VARAARRAAEAAAVCVTEVPLLYETAARSASTRRRDHGAAGAPRAAGAGRADDRERALIPDEEKAERADFAYVNDGTLEDLDAS
jgi:dephospho-CoA kinase